MKIRHVFRLPNRKTALENTEALAVHGRGLV